MYKLNTAEQLFAMWQLIYVKFCEYFNCCSFEEFSEIRPKIQVMASHGGHDKLLNVKNVNNLCSHWLYVGYSIFE